jgi:LmbE family N-acetylglucosaminyl deacetylase
MAVVSLTGVRSLVILGAHPDDVEIACGGTLLALAAASPGLAVRYVLLSGTPERQAEARSAAAAFLPGARIDFALSDLPDGRLPEHWGEVKRLLHEAADPPSPDLVISPWAGDAHQDHRLIGELVPTVWRGTLALQYEIPKWDGDLGRPNVYVPLTQEHARRKAELLGKHYPSQHQRSWWDDEVFLGLARLRGVECGARYAEAFHNNKTVLTIDSGDQQ